MDGQGLGFIEMCSHWQGSHSDWKNWKTWKNGKAFFSQGKVREFEWTGKVREKSGKITENTGKLRGFHTNIICYV